MGTNGMIHPGQTHPGHPPRPGPFPPKVDNSLKDGPMSPASSLGKFEELKLKRTKIDQIVIKLKNHIYAIFWEFQNKTKN